MKPPIRFPGMLARIAVLAFLSAAFAPAQQTPATPRRQPSEEEVRKGVGDLVPRADYSQADPLPVVKKFEGLRVTDVTDAMDAVGLQDVMNMDRTIRPLWRDTSDRVRHRICGAAITVQFVPTNQQRAGKWPLEEYNKWKSNWYGAMARDHLDKLIRPGTVVVFDAHGAGNVGFIGSNNALGWTARGAAGVVTNGGVRDTDEVILEGIPVYSQYTTHGIRPGRIETLSVNLPVSVGGVLVRPGDIILADGDGVVVVPRERAEEVAEVAWKIAAGDKASRRKLYEKLGRPLDATVK